MRVGNDFQVKVPAFDPGKSQHRGRASQKINILSLDNLINIPANLFRQFFFRIKMGLFISGLLLFQCNLKSLNCFKNLPVQCSTLFKKGDKPVIIQHCKAMIK